MKSTLIIVGPSGSGKSPLNDSLSNEVKTCEPHRFRDAPRDAGDIRYMNRGAFPHLIDMLIRLKAEKTVIATSPQVEIYRQARVCVLDVRGTPQVLFLDELSPTTVKCEIYGPAACVLFQNPEIRAVLGELFVVALNPAGPLGSPGASRDIAAMTFENCRRRGDDEATAEKRAASVADEVESWRDLLKLGAGDEHCNWEFPEYRYRADKVGTLVAARKRLIDRRPELARFFLTETAIQNKFSQ